MVIICDYFNIVSVVKFETFYVEYFDRNFVLDYVWSDRFYLCVSSILIFLTLFIIDITDYNFRLFFKSNLVEFYFFILNALFFFLIGSKSSNFIVTLLSIIGFSVVTYFIILSDSQNSLACESCIKYYYLSILSSILVAIGIFIIFFKFGTASFSKLNLILYYCSENKNDELNFTFVSSVLFIVTGLLFKLNCFPCHWWSADVYYGLNYNVLAFFVLPVKFCVYVLLSKILFGVFSSLVFL